MTRRKTGLARRNPNDFGSVEKRGERYRALFRRDGRTIRAPRTFTTRDDARHWLSEQERALRGGTWIDPRLSEDSLAAYVAAWLSDHSADLSPRTVENYSRHLTKWVLPRLGKERLGEITPAKVRSWRAGCLKDAAAAAGAGQEQPSAVSIRAWAVVTGLDVAPTGRLPQHIVLAWNAAGCPTLTKRTRRGTGAAAVAAAYAVLRTVLATAEREELIPRNPCRIRGAATVKSAERKPATPEQVRSLADAMPERYAAAVIVAAWSGLRSGELRALARRHVDLDAGTIRVERAILELSGQKPTFGRTKTEGSRRVVALPEFVMEQLRRHMEAYVGSSEGSLLFCTEDGGILTRTWLGQMFRRAQKRAGLESLGLAWHDLRHTGASLAYAVGSSVVDVQRRLGHTTMTAANRYAHAYASSDAAVAARLHAAFGRQEEAA